MVDTSDHLIEIEDDYTFDADADRLRSLFENLFRNAVEHGSTSSRTESDDAVEHTSTSPRSQAPDDAVEHTSTSPRSQAPDDAVEHTSTSPRSQAPDDAIEHGDGEATVTVGALADGDGFFVADDGPGIPEADRESVFESGFTTAAEGTGFGLAIVKEVVDAHGWTIGVTESESGGARFEVRGVTPAA
jgi:signal transduction histidine kinase